MELLADHRQTTQVDGVVVNVIKMGFFAEVGPLSVFVSSHVGPP